MSTPYLGQNDYRGYLNYLSQKSTGPLKGQAGYLLKNVGNDAVFGNRAANPFGSDIYNTNQKLYNQYNTLQAGTDPGLAAYTNALKSAMASIGGGSMNVAAPNYNLASISAQARKEAGRAQSPIYQLKMNQFLAQQKFDVENQKAQDKADIQTLQDTLSNTLKQNEVTGQRTSQDTATNLGQINTTADQFQTDAGAEADAQRIADAKQQAAGGLTGSGVGQGQTLQAQTTQNTAESRQGAQFTQQRQAQNLMKARTFEDLAAAGGLAKTSEVKGEKQIAFNLNTLVQNQKLAKAAKGTELKIEKQQAIEADTARRAQTKLNKLIQSIANPAQRDAARGAYGNAF